MEYSYVFKFQNKKKVYISSFDDNGQPLHTENESKAFRFHDLDEAMRYYYLGYGVITKVF